MTGTRGKKTDPEGNENFKPETPDTPDAHQQASKRDIRSTQSMVTELEDKITGLNQTLGNLTEKLGQADTKFSQHDLRLAYLEAKTKALHSENKRLKDRVDVLENEKRTTNLKIDGVKESDRENLSDIILRLSTAIGVRCQPSDIEFVYRIGKSRPADSRPRSILVHFKTQSVRDNIYYGRSKLRRDDEWKQVYVNDDVNESTRKKRDDLRAVATLCQVKNIAVKLHSDSIIINGRKYTEHQLDCSLQV